MRKGIKKLLTVALTATLGLAALAGCGTGTSSNGDGSANGGTTKELSGKIQLAGSTSMEKMCGALMEAFMEEYPNVTVTTEYTGSGAGIESVTSGAVDIGNASRALSDKEKSAGIEENIVAIDGIAVITDTANTITDIKSEDLAKVYTGEITNWKDLGGPDEQIVVIGREAGSGTRDAFEELMDVKDSCKYAQELDSTGAVLAKVAATPGAVGYVSLDVLDDTVNGLKINSVEPTEDNILAGDYVLQRPFVMATKGEISEQSKQVQAYFDFINSADGQNVIKSVGLIIPNK